ncbi:MAG: hypothetical protein GY861_13700 [bacterium]|nr:hypothetical protein [bacterium]
MEKADGVHVSSGQAVIDVNMVLDDPSGGPSAGSISGVTIYTGSSTGTLRVLYWNEPGRGGPPIGSTVALTASATTWTYTLADLTTPATFYLTSFIDSNANSQFDSMTEPYMEKADGVHVSSGQAVIDVNMVLDDPSGSGGSLSVNGVQPISIMQGSNSIYVDIYGSEFSTAAVVTISDSDVNVDSYHWSNTGYMYMFVSVSSVAATGFKTIRVTNPDTSYAEFYNFSIQQAGSGGSGAPTGIDVFAMPWNPQVNGTSTLEAWIKDNNHNNVPDASNPVSFVRTSGLGNFSGYSAAVDSVTVDAVNGLASIDYIASSTSGYVYIEAMSPGLYSGYMDLQVMEEGSSSNFGTISGDMSYNGSSMGSSSTFKIEVFDNPQFSSSPVVSKQMTQTGYYEINNAPANMDLYIRAYRDINFNGSFDSASDPNGAYNMYGSTLPQSIWLNPYGYMSSIFIEVNDAGVTPSDMYVDYVSPFQLSQGGGSIIVDVYGNFVTDVSSDTSISFSPSIQVSTKTVMSSSHIRLTLNITESILPGYYDIILKDNRGSYSNKTLFGAIQIVGTTNSGEPSMISCYPMPSSLPADGASESTIRAEIVDFNFNMVGSATNDVTFSLTGPGTLVGDNPVAAVNGVATINVMAGSVQNTSIEIKAESSGLSDGWAYVSMYSTSSGSSYATVSGFINYYGTYSSASGDIYVLLTSSSSLASTIDVTVDTSTIKVYTKAAADKSYNMPDVPSYETLYLMCFKDLNSDKKYDSSSEPYAFLPYPHNMSMPEPLYFMPYEMRYFDVFMNDPGSSALTAFINEIQPYSFSLPTVGTTYYFTIFGDGMASGDTIELKSPSGSLDVTSSEYLDSHSLKGSVLIQSSDYPGSYDIVLKDMADGVKAMAPGMAYLAGQTNTGSGQATQIMCWADMYSIPADSQTTTIIHAEIVDANYNRVTNATDKITFSVSGALDVVSVNPTYASYGEAQLTVQAKGSSDDVRITASAQDLVSGNVEINTYDPGSGSAYATIDGNVFYSGSEPGSKYVKAILAPPPPGPAGFTQLETIASTAALAALGLHDGEKNMLTLDAMSRTINSDLQGANQDVVEELINNFPHGGWLGTSAADNFGHYKINDANSQIDLMVFAFVDVNSDGMFAKDPVTPSYEPFGFYKFYGTMGDHPAVLWLMPNDFMNYVNIDIKDPVAGGSELDIQVYGIDPPSFPQALPGQSATTKNVWVYGSGFVPGSVLSFYPNNPPISVTNTNYIDQYSLTAEIEISSNVYAGDYDVVVTSANSSAKSYKIFHIDSSMGSNSISGVVTYSGGDGATGKIYVGVFKGNSAEGEPFMGTQSVSDSTDTYSYSFSGLPDGQYSVYSIMDTDGTGTDEDPKEPFGMCPENPIYLYGGIAKTNADIQLFKMSYNSTYISGVSPPSLEQGETDRQITLFGGNLSGAVNLNFGPGVTVTTFTATEYDIIATVSISTSAYLGDRTVQVTDNTDYIANAMGIFRVTGVGVTGSGKINGTISYVSSDGSGSGTKGGTIITAIWRGGLFQGPPLKEVYNTYLTTAPSPANYEISGLDSDNYSIFAFVDLNSDYVPDMNEPQAIYQFNPVYVSDGLTTRVDMTIFDYASSGGSNITVTDVMPKYVMAGTQVAVEVYGSGFQSDSKVLFGQGISISSSTPVTVSTATGRITAEINIADNANEGFRNVNVTNSDGSFGIGMNMLIVQPSMATQQLAAGDGSISGTLFNNSGSTGTYVIALWDGYIFNGPPVRMETMAAPAGVASSTYSITGLADSSQYYLGVYIDTNDNMMPDHDPFLGLEEPETVYGSFDSPRAIIVSGGSQVKNVNLTFEQAVTIDVKEFMPNVMSIGTSQDIYIFGYGFSSSITTSHVSISGPDITLNSVRHIDFSQIVLDITIAAGAPVGVRTVTITNPGDATTASGTIELVASVGEMVTATGEEPFDVIVKDDSGSPIENALVMAVSFNAMNFEPDATISRSGYTKSDGRVTLYLRANKDYMIAAGKHMYKSSIKVQMMSPSNVPVRTTAGSKTVTLTRRPDPDYATTQEYEKVGIITGKISNVRLSSTPRVLLMSVDNRRTYEPVNFAMISAASKTIYYSIGNIPITSRTDEYQVNIFDPAFGIGTGAEITSAVLVSEDGTTNALEVNLDFEDVESLSTTGDKEVTRTDDSAFEGLIYEDLNSNGSYDEGEGIENARIRFRSYAYRDDGMNSGIEGEIEVVTNASGKYTLYGLPLYQTSDSGADYYTPVNYVGPSGGTPNNNTYSVTVFVQGYNGVNDFYGSASGKYSDYERTYAGSKKTLNYPLSQATGSINGYVYLGSVGDGNKIPADINVWPDHNSYGNMPSNPGLSHGHTRADNGLFELTGLGDGNYMLNIWSEFSQRGFEYNYGDDGQYGGGDDLRVTVKDGSYAVYQASSGIKVADTTNPINIILKQQGVSGITADCNVRGTVTLLKSGMDLTGTMVVAREDWNSISENDEWGNRRPPRTSFVQLGTATVVNNTITYEITIPTGSYYVRLNSQKNGVLGEPEYRVQFQDTGSVRNNVDFDIAPAGRIRGVVRLPNGKLFIPDWNQQQWMWINAEGENVDCWSGTDVNDKGEFNINGVLPGIYTLMSHLPESIDYANPFVENVIVTAGQETIVNIDLQDANDLVHQVTGLPGDPAEMRETGSGNLVSNVAILAIESGKEFTIADDILDMGEETPSSTYADWGSIQGGASSWGWSALKLSPGEYDFYLTYFSQFGGGGDHGTPGFSWSNETAFGTILDKATGVTLSTETISFTYSKGLYEISGSAKGQNVFTEEDIKKASTNFDYFISLIPKITILDSNGIQKAGGAVIPKIGTFDGSNWSGMAVLEQLDEWIETSNVAAVINYFNNPANVQYKIGGLAAGDYTLVAKSKNYPPVVKRVTIGSSNIVQNIDFDSDVSESGRLTGTVKVKNSTETIAGATIVLTIGTEQKKANSGIDGIYTFDGLPGGNYKVKVTASGYGFKEDKVVITKGQIVTKNFEFEEVVRSSLTGTIYKQKIPYPRTYAGATVVLLDQTEQAASDKKIATKFETTTGDNGQYSFTDLASGHVFKLYVVVPGYKLAEYTISKATYTETQDVVLQSDPPNVSIFQWRDENDDIQFQIESNKLLVTKPTVNFIQGLSNVNVSAFIVEGLDKIYKMTIYKAVNAAEMDIADFPASGFDIEQDIGIRVVGTDGSQEGVGTATLNLKSKAKVEQILSTLIAVGGDVSVDKSGTDKSKITINPGALTTTGSDVTPTITIDKTSVGDETAIDDEETGLTASNIYSLDIENAVLAGDSPLTLTFDYDETKDTESVTVCYYDAGADQWSAIDTTVTKDLVSGTLEIDVTASDITTTSGASMFASAPYIKGKGYVAAKAVIPEPVRKANTILSGVKFAVFTAAPDYTIAEEEQGQVEANATYSGDEFRIYNFPNPFSLESKTVRLANTGTNSALAGDKTVTGTVLKYYFPTKYDGKAVKFYIYNIAGELVRVIDDEPARDGGYIYFSEWDGKNDNGKKCASGIYFMFSKIDGSTVTDNPLKAAIVK